MKKILPLTFLLTYTMTGHMENKKKYDIPDENLLASTNKCQEKLWFPLQSLGTAPRIRPFFVNENGIKVNKESYCKHLKNSCFLQLKNLIRVMTGYLSKIVLCHNDRIWYKISLKNTLKRRFVKKRKQKLCGEIVQQI